MGRPLIATDLDGTLLMTGTHTPHPDAVEAVNRAIAADIPIVFATGRAPSEIQQIADEVGHRWFAVCCDGTALVDLRVNEVFRTHPIPADVKRAVVERLRAVYPDVRFLAEAISIGPVPPVRDGLLVERGFEAPWAWALEGARGVDDINEVIDNPDIVKLCAFRNVPNADPHGFDGVTGVLSDLVTSVRIGNELTFVDICARGVSKATGVAEFAELEGISPEDVFAVGDMHNDYELLLWAGRSFAVANAVERLHEVADLIVPTNDEGGVVQVVEAALLHLRQS